jgi:gp16 family phage-associated protein
MELKTPSDVRTNFLREGISIADWCRNHDIPRHVVNDLLRGKCAGRRGKSHNAAILLGLKNGSLNVKKEINSKPEHNGNDHGTVD